ncbi:Synaptic vesicle 2-related protein [Trichoplax sp. H2]|nr:Synaptic vesicle 2-related protein [Trichoplax sp. H2]|eukprot:RDD39092.1 Synaptic vesicle 2-related protein [Trichoplax sp. H2]
MATDGDSDEITARRRLLNDDHGNMDEMDFTVLPQTCSPDLTLFTRLDKSKEITVNEVVEAIGFGKFQLKCLGIMGFIWMIESMEITMLSLLGPLLVCEWGISSIQEALLTSIVFLGYAIGSPCFGWVSDHYGRKVGLTIAVICTSYFGLISAAAGGLVMTLLLRSLAGIGVGGIAQCVTMLTELVPSKTRAKSIISLQVFVFIGMSFEGLLAYLLLVPLGWRMLLVISTVPLLAFLLLSPRLVESPRFLLLTGKRKEATDILEKGAKANNKSIPEGILVADLETDRGRFKDLFSPSYRTLTFMLWWIWIASVTLYYSTILMTPALTKVTRCGHGDGNEIVHCRCKQVTNSDIVAIIIASIGELLGGLVAFLLIDRLGRKRTLAFGFILAMLSYLLLIICADRTTKYGLTLFSRSCGSGLSLLCYVYSPEVYPTKFRAVGIGTANAVGRIGAILSPFIAQVLFSASDILALVVAAGFALVGAICSLFLPLETKGRLLQDTN